MDLSKVDVPVGGGHGGYCCLPLFSKMEPTLSFSDMDILKMTSMAQDEALMFCCK